MQTFHCNVGRWRAEARIDEIQNDRVMAVISVTDDNDLHGRGSRHTVVFEHRHGNDSLQETEILVRRILHARF